MSALGSRYDAWVTREPDWAGLDEYVSLHCAQCGAFLKRDPDSSETKEQTEHCDGKQVVFTSTYTEADAGVLDIIGWEHLGETYEVPFDPPCNEQQREHEPHEYVVWAWVEHHRICGRCGVDNVEVGA